MPPPASLGLLFIESAQLLLDLEAWASLPEQTQNARFAILTLHLTDVSPILKTVYNVEYRTSFVSEHSGKWRNRNLELGGDPGLISEDLSECNWPLPGQERLDFRNWDFGPPRRPQFNAT
ncbi:hypothetical protein DFH06DRAFT_1299132 [Mycena polygramma]|nr:hypothetical protein DFH06DRAFT_1299132 [Mycena polygramma]